MLSKEERYELFEFANENLNHLVIDCNLKVVRLDALCYYMGGDGDLPTFDFEVTTIEGETSITCARIKELYPLKHLDTYPQIVENFLTALEIAKYPKWQKNETKINN